MKNFRRWIRNWLSEHDNFEFQPELAPVRSTRLDNPGGMRFTIYKANGGMVIESNIYDRHKDENIHGLYLVTDEQDLGEEINKIVTMELMRRR